MLHGEVKVNDIVIGTWKAVRKERIYEEPQPLTDNALKHRYECHVTYRNMAGYPNEAKFDVVHHYNDGALTLASKILRKSVGAMRPIKMEEDEETQAFFRSVLS